MTVRRLRRAAAVAALAIAASACTIEFGTPQDAPSGVTSPDPSPSPVPTGKGSAAAAMAALCDVPAPPERGDPKPAEEPPADIAEVEAQVEQVRGLDLARPVAIEPVTQEQIERRLMASFERTVPEELNARRSMAWQTMGVIPDGTEITDAMRSFLSGQVVGFYDPAKQALVYIGQEELTTTSRYILAHELTHALDDQHFDLTRLDPLAARCDDEAFMAGLGAVEGSAQFTATQVVIRFREPGEEFGGTEEVSTEDIPPFIVQTQLWPYEDGLRFIDQLDRRGGREEVDGALERFPVSTEQVIHPDRYPNDTPQPVDVPDLARRMPGTWEDLDVMIVGEAWLRIMLELRIDGEIADRAAAGWDGGLYRAWSDGDRVAVVLKTVWDTADDARAFAEALRAWIGDEPGFVEDPRDGIVMASFATDRAVLDRLRDAIGAPTTAA